MLQDKNDDRAAATPVEQSGMNLTATPVETATPSDTLQEERPDITSERQRRGLQIRDSNTGSTQMMETSQQEGVQLPAKKSRKQRQRSVPQSNKPDSGTTAAQGTVPAVPDPEVITPGTPDASTGR